MSYDAKRFPVIENDINYVNITIYANIIDNEILHILSFLQKHYQLNPKEIIALGVVAREKKILGYDLSRILQLKDDDRLRNWINNLIAEIHKRMDDLDLKYLRRVVYKMYDERVLSRDGIRSNMVYFVAK